MCSLRHWNKFLILLIALVGWSCGRKDPLYRAQQDFEGYPQYSILLADMKEEGNFFKDYYHRYKVIYAEKAGEDSVTFKEELLDWQPVKREQYEHFEPFLGMALVSKTPGEDVNDVPQPPGYQYVGDSRYGEWRTDEHGQSFWVFYGRYALMRDMLGYGLGGRVYRGEYDDYRGYRRSGRPYYGGQNQYGTGGNVAQKTNPNFFERRQARDAGRRATFMDRVSKRTKRSNMSSTRRRSSSGFGK